MRADLQCQDEDLEAPGTSAPDVRVVASLSGPILALDDLGVAKGMALMQHLLQHKGVPPFLLLV